MKNGIPEVGDTVLLNDQSFTLDTMENVAFNRKNRWILPVNGTYLEYTWDDERKAWVNV